MVDFRQVRKETFLGLLEDQNGLLAETKMQL